MFKTLWLFFISMNYIFSETLDKKKILEIIKSAKVHKAQAETAISVSEPTTNTSETEPIVVYRKKETTSKTESKHLMYGTLPALAPASKALQKQFNVKDKRGTEEVGFTKPQKNRATGINTEGKKIEYNQ